MSLRSRSRSGGGAVPIAELCILFGRMGTGPGTTRRPEYLPQTPTRDLGQVFGTFPAAAGPLVSGADRTFTIQGRLYEAPVNLVGKQVRLLYHEHDPVRVEVLWDGKTYGFANLLDVNVNCRIKRENGITGIDPGNAPEKYKGGNLFRRTEEAGL